MPQEDDLGRDRFKVWEEVRVRWADMDSFGHINNAKYFTFCESGRIRYFEAIDLDSFREHEQQGPVAASATCNFRRQGHYPALLEVGTRAVKLGRTSFVLQYGIFEKDSDTLMADGSSVVVWLDYGDERPIPLPEEMKEVMRRLDGVD